MIRVPPLLCANQKHYSGNIIEFATKRNDCHYIEKRFR